MVGSCDDLIHLLEVGSMARATSATACNELSSRSHAIFTIVIEQTITSSGGSGGGGSSSGTHSNGSASLGGGGNAAAPGGSGAHMPLTPRGQLLNQLQRGGGGGHTATADSHSLGPRSSGGSVGRGGSQGSGDQEGVQGAVEYRCAKLHLVDLAGSERTKRSGVVGARFKETVGINQVGGGGGFC